GGRERRLLQDDVDRRSRAREGGHRDLRAAHGVAAQQRVVGNARRRAAGNPVLTVRIVRSAVPGDVERNVLAVDRGGAGRAGEGGVDAVARQDRDEVALERVEVDLAGVQRLLLRRVPAYTVADVAGGGGGEGRVGGVARDRA